MGGRVRDSAVGCQHSGQDCQWHMRQYRYLRGTRMGPYQAAPLLPSYEHQDVGASNYNASSIAAQILGLQGGALHKQDADVRRYGNGRDGRSGHDRAIHSASLESLDGSVGSVSLAAAEIGLLVRASSTTRVSMKLCHIVSADIRISKDALWCDSNIRLIKIHAKMSLISKKIGRSLRPESFEPVYGSCNQEFTFISENIRKFFSNYVVHREFHSFVALIGRTTSSLGHC